MIKQAVGTSEEVSSQFGAEQQEGSVKMHLENQSFNWKKMRESYAQLKKEHDIKNYEMEVLKKELSSYKTPSQAKAGAEQQEETVKTHPDSQFFNWKKMRESYAQLKKEHDVKNYEMEALEKEFSSYKAPSQTKARETLVELLDCGDVNVRLQAAIFLLK